MEENRELPNTYQQIADVIGVDATLRLCRSFGGMNLYVPKVDKLEAEMRRESVIRDWNGYNAKELAKKYCISEYHVRRMVKEHYEEMAQQMSMDDLL